MQRYGAVSKSLHWTIALAILGLMWLGWYMVGLGYYDPFSQDALMWHRSIGLAVIVLAGIALIWHFYRAPPPYCDNLKPWEKNLASGVHGLLFALMFLLPISGYLISSSAGSAVAFFDWFSVPALFYGDDELRNWAIESHYYMAYIGLGIIVLHGLAALKHHFIDRDDTLKKMWW